jgi:hypothetical protein
MRTIYEIPTFFIVTAVKTSNIPPFLLKFYIFSWNMIIFWAPYGRDLDQMPLPLI